MKHEFRGRWAALLLGAFLAFTVCPGTASANTAVVIPPSIDMSAPADVLESAAGELMRLIRVQGFDVISPGQASAAAEDAQASGTFPAHLNVLDCRTVECAIEYRRLFDASFAAQLFLSGLSGRVRTVTVTITESEKVSFTGTATPEGGDLKSAIQVAYGAARDKYVRGEGPWLSIAGGPSGAEVLLDGQEYGTLPIEHRYIAPGAHELTVRLSGYAGQTQSLEIPARIDHEERLSVSLIALNGGGHDGPKLNRTWDYVIGGVLAAVGAAHLAAGAVQWSKRGDCAEWADATHEHCKLVYGDTDGNSQEKLLMGLGAAGVAAGAIWMGVGPIARATLRADARSASLSLSGSF